MVAPFTGAGDGRRRATIEYGSLLGDAGFTQGGLKVDRVGVQRYVDRPLGRTTPGSAAGWLLSETPRTTHGCSHRSLKLLGFPPRAGA